MSGYLLCLFLADLAWCGGKKLIWGAKERGKKNSQRKVKMNRKGKILFC